MGDKYYGRVYNRFKRSNKDGKVDTKSEAFQEALAREYDLAVKNMGKKFEHRKGEIPNKVIKGMMKTSLIIVGVPGCGKSNCAKVITSKIIRGEVLKNKEVHTAIIDTAQNYRHNFENIPFQEINEETEFMYWKPNIVFLSLIHI